MKYRSFRLQCTMTEINGHFDSFHMQANLICKKKSPAKQEKVLIKEVIFEYQREILIYIFKPLRKLINQMPLNFESIILIQLLNSCEMISCVPFLRR